jgi:hypothetical protein
MSLKFASQTPPIRLQRAVWIWLAMAPLAAVLPGSSSQSVGLLAHPAFWCGLLPLLALAPYARQLLLAEPQAQRRRTALSHNIKRRSRPRQARRLAA